MLIRRTQPSQEKYEWVIRPALHDLNSVDWAVKLQIRSDILEKVLVTTLLRQCVLIRIVENDWLRFSTMLKQRRHDEIAST